MHQKLTLTLLLLFALGETPASAESSCPDADDIGAVTLEKVEPAGGTDFAVYWRTETTWPVHHALEPRLGGDIEVLRCVPPGRWLQLGRGVFTSSSWELAEAVVRSDNSPAALEAAGELGIGSKFGNLYWRPMKGDIVRPVRPDIVKRQFLAKEFQYSLQDLFVEAGSERSAELSAGGKSRLVAAAKTLAATGSRIIVECFSNTAGQRELLRRETQIRAYAVAKFLSGALSLPSEKFVPIGIGSDGLDSHDGDASAVEQPLEAGVSLRVLPD